MKKPFGKKSKSGGSAPKVFWGGMAVSFLLLAWGWPNLTEKEKALAASRSAGLVLDWRDVALLSENEDQALAKAQEAGATGILLPVDAETRLEELIRAKQFSLLWKGDPESHETWAPVSRAKKGDGLLSSGEVMWGYPRDLTAVAEWVKRHQVFLPKVEFSNTAGFAAIASRSSAPIIKTHCLQAKETLTPQIDRWLDRFERAALERSVRLFYFQFSPSLSPRENLAFMSALRRSLSEWGLAMSPSVSDISWAVPFACGMKRIAKALAFAWAILVPCLAALIAGRKKWKSPFLGFLAVTLLSAAGGLAVQALTASPGLVSGLEAMRGVKAQLLFPLVISFFLLMSIGELKRAADSPVKWGGLALLGGGALLFIAVYLMRSGNFPLLPVPDWERGLRDGLENLLGVRPRFKEFLIGHPLLLLGMFLHAQSDKPSFFKDGRLFILMGLVGPISIVNTFTHAHTPLVVSLLRTVHGVWIGLAVGIGLCALSSKILEKPEGMRASRP